MRTGMRCLSFTVAAITGVLGTGSLLSFVAFLWIGDFGLLDLRLSESAILTWNAGLCLLFFVQHSGMVRKSFRSRLIRVLPLYCHGVVYTIASAVALLVLTACWQGSTAAEIYIATGAVGWLVRAVFLISLAGFMWGIRSVGQFDAFGLQVFLSERRDERHPAKLTTEGPYRFVRHPFYCFCLVALWATPALSVDRLLLNALFTIWIVLGANLEERDLLAEFGQPYKRYQNAVPMFVPDQSHASGTQWRNTHVDRGAATCNGSPTQLQLAP